MWFHGSLVSLEIHSKLNVMIMILVLYSTLDLRQHFSSKPDSHHGLVLPPITQLLLWGGNGKHEFRTPQVLVGPHSKTWDNAALVSHVSRSCSKAGYVCLLYRRAAAVSASLRSLESPQQCDAPQFRQLVCMNGFQNEEAKPPITIGGHLPYIFLLRWPRAKIMCNSKQSATAVRNSSGLATGGRILHDVFRTRCPVEAG